MIMMITVMIMKRVTLISTLFLGSTIILLIQYPLPEPSNELADFAAVKQRVGFDKFKYKDSKSLLKPVYYSWRQCCGEIMISVEF